MGEGNASTIVYYNNVNFSTESDQDSNDNGYNLEAALPFLTIGSFGVFLNGFTVVILGSSVRLRKKILNTLIIHQSIIDLICSASLIGTAHLSTTDIAVSCGYDT